MTNKTEENKLMEAKNHIFLITPYNHDGFRYIKAVLDKTADTVIQIKENESITSLFDDFSLFVREEIKLRDNDELPLYLYLVKTTVSGEYHPDTGNPGQVMGRFVVISKYPLPIDVGSITNKVGKQFMTLKTTMNHNLLSLTEINIQTIIEKDAEMEPVFFRLMESHVDYFLNQLRPYCKPLVDDVKQCQDVGDNENLNQDLWLKPGILYKLNQLDTHAVSVAQASLLKERKHFLMFTGEEDTRYIYIDDTGIPPMFYWNNKLHASFDALLKNKLDGNYRTEINEVNIQTIDGAAVVKGFTIGLRSTNDESFTIRETLTEQLIQILIHVYCKMMDEQLRERN